MTTSSWTGVNTAAVLLVGLVALTGVVGVGFVGVTVADTDHTENGLDEGAVGPITECFAGTGYPLVIGDPPTTIDALVHLSVLTDPDSGGELGAELAGTMNDERIVTLAAGVQLNRVGLLATGVDPFAAFDILYTYEFRLPMFDGLIDASSYEADGPPVSGAAGTVPC